jgi:3-methyladenine DNA glycosylase AlkD
VNEIKEEIKRFSCPKKAVVLSRFFKTKKGEYGQGDFFLGLTVPQQRLIARQYRDLSLRETEKLLKEKIHEYRLVALMILIIKYERGDDKKKKEIVEIYFKNLKFINNWDLVDLSAPKIIGDYFLNKSKKRIEKLSLSKNLWARRIAIVSTLNFIRNDHLETTFLFSEKLLKDKHDLIHKAVGWMLREAGKKDKDKLVDFLEKHTSEMPRTMLRYSIEKFPEKQRKKFLSY